MATSMTKNTSTKQTESKIEKKKFAPDDLIPCRSITGGELFMEGAKTKFLYKWADYDDIQEVEYQDLAYDVKTGKSFSKYPRFIVLDEDFVEQNPSLNDIYEKLYSFEDLRDILMLDANQLKKVISELPKGAKESIKSLASTMIRDGSFDSVNKIKVIDEVFETQMLSTLANN